MNVTMVPFGNAHIRLGKVTCQHGPAECTGNSYEQCAIDIYPEFYKHFPFYECLESHGESMKNYFSQCAKDAGLDIEKIEACVNDEARALALQKKFAAMTPADHKYTPWVLVDGTLSKSDGDKILKEVCDAYTGTKPAGCPALAETKRCSADW